MPPILFVVKYFTAAISEWDIDLNDSILLNIPWADPGFHTSFEGQEVLANRYYDYIQRIENANTNG